jgi:3-oxoacyl-[acyl-carrier protein] reductase
MDDLAGRAALVTGASRGIGRAIALALAAAGADVAVNYRSRADAAEEVCAEIRRLGRRAIKIAADVARAAEATRLVAEAEAALGPIGILVNNAGVAVPVTLETLTEAVWDATIAQNLSSTAAQIGGVVGPHYAASKAGLHGMTHAYAALLVRDGITANAIAPALIDTDMVRNDLRAKPDRIPVGRFGRVEEVADTAVMLARNGYVTGQTINVNGGIYMS